MCYRSKQFYLKSIEVAGLTYCFNFSKKKMVNFQIFFARLAQLFCLKRNNAASSARYSLGAVFLAKIFEKKTFVIFYLLSWRFSMFFFVAVI